MSKENKEKELKETVKEEGVQEEARVLFNYEIII